MTACVLPEIFAACRVLHRLQAPRHPPCALNTFSSLLYIRFSIFNRYSLVKVPRKIYKSESEDGQRKMCSNSFERTLGLSPVACQLSSLSTVFLFPVCPLVTSFLACVSGVFLHRKEVIQPHLPVRLPCYDFTPLTGHTLDGSSLNG